MLASTEDARLLFGRWREDAPPLKTTVRNGSLIFQATGRLVDFTNSALQLHGPAWQLTIPLEGARFTFSDPREVPSAAIRAAETAKYEFGLAIDLPNGDRLALMELKAEDEEPEPSS
jgi:hypothetical protein